VTADPLAALFAELGRLRDLARLESHLHNRGFLLIGGVDEAGRGSLAGPVVAAAVVLPPECVLPGLDDSKQVDAETRERLDREIRRCSLALGVGVVEARDIDAGDILRASLEAMRIAVMSLALEPDVLLVDAVRVPAVRVPQVPVVHGDALSASIAAASIVAKVHRDGLLEELGRRYPAYGFEGHKGYGTPEHWEALRRYGPCREHRLTYRGVVPGAGEQSERVRSNRRRG
jgi:ribonuclease HII